MTTPSQNLPDPSECEQLLDALAELIGDAGHEHFVSCPIVPPTPEYFPDRWERNAAGVWRLARRLLTYAGLESLDVDITLFDDQPKETSYDHSTQHAGAAAWFAGIDDGVCLFGANVNLLGDPLGVTASIAHECSHAFRCARALTVEDIDHEEQLTDLTTAYLGFGILSANASSRHRSWNPDGRIAATAWSFQSLGYLSPQAQTFLLAVQLQVRGLDATPVRQYLEVNQEAYLVAAIRWLASNVPNLVERLGLPSRESWPPPVDLDTMLGPLGPTPQHLSHDEPTTDGVLETSPQSVDRTASRVPYSRSLPIGTAAGIGGFVAVLALLGSESSSAIIALTVAAGSAVAGWKLGGTFPRWECSACGSSVRRRDARCSQCGARLTRDLAKPEDRLEDEPEADVPRHVGSTYRNDERADLDPSLVDGSQVPRAGEILLASHDLRPATEAELHTLERRLDVTLPEGYASTITILGAGIYSGWVELWMPERIMDEQAQALAPLRDGLFETAPTPINPKQPTGFTVLGFIGEEDLLGTHTALPRRLLWLRSGGAIVDIGETFRDVIEALIAPRSKPEVWFAPASISERMAFECISPSLDAILVALLEFGPGYLEAEAVRDGAPPSWIFLSPNVGTITRLERMPRDRWAVDVSTDREHQYIAEHIERALSNLANH